MDPASHTFEARAPTPVVVDKHLIAIVVDPSKLTSHQLGDLRARAKRSEYCEFLQCGGGERPYDRTRRYIDAVLRDAGVPLRQSSCRMT